MKSRTRVGLLIPLLSFAVYLPALQGGWIWDDKIISDGGMIYRSDALATIWLRLWEFSGEVHYWPVTYTSFWLEDRLWGLSSSSAHIVNVTLHAINTMLAWKLLEKIGIDERGAALGALLFAVHPVHVEPVAWIIARKDLLSALFFLMAVHTWRGRQGGLPSATRTAACGGLMVLGMLSKTTAGVLPGVLVVLHWWLGRPRWTNISLWLRVGALGATALVIVAIDYEVQERAGDVLNLDRSPMERLTQAAQGIFFYLGKLIWPSELIVIYREFSEGAIGWVAVVAIAAIAISLARVKTEWSQGLLAAGGWFILLLFPSIGFVNQTYLHVAPVADRYQYLASLGPLAAAGVGLAALTRLSGREARWGGWTAAIAAICMLGWLCWQQAGFYRTEVGFFQYILKHNPVARDAHYNLASALLGAGRVAESIVAAEKAKEQEPSFVEARIRLAMALTAAGKLEKAEQELVVATRMPRSGPWSQVTAHHNLGWVYWTKEDLEQALEQFELTVKIAPRFRTESRTAKAGIVMTLHDMGKTPQAVAYAMKSRMEAVHPRENAEMDLALGRILAREGRLQEAREVLVNAARWPATGRNGRIELAAVLVLLGRSHEALATIGKENGKLEDLRPIADLMQERGHMEYAGEIRNELLERAWND